MADFVESSKIDKKTVEKIEKKARLSKGNAFLVCYAGGKFVEGVEFVEEGHSTIKRVIILGVPYSRTSDIAKERIKKISEGRGRDLKWEILRSEALVSIKQAIGRAIRNPSDEADIIFLENRFKTFFGELGISKEVRDISEL